MQKGPDINLEIFPSPNYRIHIFLWHMEHSPQYVICEVTKHVSTNSEKIDITPNIFSNNNEMKLEISNLKKSTGSENMWKLNNVFLNNLCATGKN